MDWTYSKRRLDDIIGGRDMPILGLVIVIIWIVIMYMLPLPFTILFAEPDIYKFIQFSQFAFLTSTKWVSFSTQSPTSIRRPNRIPRPPQFNKKREIYFWKKILTLDMIPHPFSSSKRGIYISWKKDQSISAPMIEFDLGRERERVVDLLYAWYSFASLLKNLTYCIIERLCHTGCCSTPNPLDL